MTIPWGTLLHCPVLQHLAEPGRGARFKQDNIVPAGDAGFYSVVSVTSLSGKSKNATISRTSFQIYSGSELVATITPEAGSGFTGNGDLSINYGLAGPSMILIAGVPLLF